MSKSSLQSTSGFRHVSSAVRAVTSRIPWNGATASRAIYGDDAFEADFADGASRASLADSLERAGRGAVIVINGRWRIDTSRLYPDETALLCASLRHAGLSDMAVRALRPFVGVL